MPIGMGIIAGLAAAGRGIKRAFRRKDDEGKMQDTGLMSLSKGLGRTGMGLGIGMGATRWKQKQQLQQQEKMNQIQLDQAGQLQEMQLEGQKEMMDYNQALGIDTWERTASPQAKVHQYKNAGLNVGMMYGGSGAGGATIPSGGGVSGQGTQIVPEVDAGMAIQAALSMEKTQAEIENIRKDTEATDTEIGYKKMLEQRGWGDLNLINAETTNEQLKSEILNIEKKIKGIQAYVDDQSKESRITEAAGLADKLEEEAIRLKNENSKWAEVYERTAQAAKAALVYQVAQTLALQEGTEFKYGTQANMIRWMEGAATLINSLYPKLKIETTSPPINERQPVKGFQK